MEFNVNDSGKMFETTCRFSNIVLVVIHDPDKPVEAQWSIHIILLFTVKCKREFFTVGGGAHEKLALGIERYLTLKTTHVSFRLQFPEPMLSAHNCQ